MLVSSLLIAAGALLSSVLTSPPSYKEDMVAWRKAKEASLRAPESWLSVSGLYWMHPGQNTIGTDPSCSVALNVPNAPPHVGSLLLLKDKAFFTAADGVSPTKDGKPFQSGDLTFDTDKVVVGTISFRVIKRGERIGVRLYNPNSRARREFKGMQWFPVNESYRVTAKFVPYPKAKEIPIKNVLGDTSLSSSPGYVLFNINGVQCRLEAQEENGGLFLNYKDLTSGKSTYPAGRFLYTAAPVDGTVEIDFNKSENPPCAFTSYATCPLPPRENVLQVKVEAGEKTHHPAE